MKKYCVYLVLSVTLYIFVACSRSSIFTKADVTRLFYDYKAAIALGDSSRIVSFWSKHSREAYGFQWLPVFIGNWLPFQKYCRFVQDHGFEIDEVETGDGYYSIRFKWLSKETQEGEIVKTHDMVTYVIREDGRWVFAQSREIFTWEWKTVESDCFIYHLPPEIDIDSHREEIRFLDDKCREIKGHLRIDSNKKFHYYKARSPKEVSEIITTGEYAGIALQVCDLLVSTRFCHVHELCHLLYRDTGVMTYNPIFSEGFAVAFGGVAGTTAEFARIESLNLLGTTKYVGLRELLTNQVDFVRNNYITYFEAGSFLRFIFDRYGLDNLIAICQISRDHPDVIGKIESVVETSIAEMERQWHVYLKQIDAPSVGHVIPDDADLIFSTDDPVADDVGDGDYTYPNDRYEEGVFDLRKFEVFKDSSRAYFRLTFRHRANPVDYGSGEMFVPGCVIAIKKGDGVKRFLQRECHGIRFDGSEGWDLKINVGTAVSISDCFDRVAFSTPELFDSISDLARGTITFSFPVETIGEPEKDWKYFVGVGLMSNRSMNFLYGGPEPVRREFPHPIFIRGGNFDHGNPAFIDILLPERMDQSKILDDYDNRKGKLAVVPMVGPLN